MPLLASDYKAPFWLKNRHVQTILPALVRNVEGWCYRRERIKTPDNDFLDLDWSPAQPNTQANKLVIITHGLEGNTHRPYMLGMVQAFNRQGVDALAWNFRSCSGEINNSLRSYHSGDTSDLLQVITYAETRHYHHIFLVGFSIGGSITLTLLGRDAAQLPASVKRAVAFSVPCDLAGSSQQLSSLINRIYMSRFISDLRVKIASKVKLYPGKISLDGYDEIKTFKEFDDRYTAPIHGFENAKDYWRKSSSKQFLQNIAIPTLLVNAKDDPFLSDSCYPYRQAQENDCFYFESPPEGGHVGFVQFNEGGSYWSEERAVKFCVGEI